MKKIKAFFYILYKSVTSVSYYKEIVKTDLSFSMKYFFTMTTLAVLIFTVFNLLPAVPKLKDTIDTLMTQARHAYPEELVITASEGQVSINQPEPYIIPMPRIPDATEENFPTNLVVFDSEGTLEDLDELDTLFLVNSVNVLVKSNNKIEVYPLNDIPDGEFSQADMNRILDRAEVYARYIPALLIAFLFIVMIFYYIAFRLVYLAVMSAILLFIGNIRGMGFAYGKFFQIAIHTSTLPLLIEVLAGLVRVPINVPFWFFAVNFLFAIVVITRIKQPEDAFEELNKPE